MVDHIESLNARKKISYLDWTGQLTAADRWKISSPAPCFRNEEIGHVLRTLTPPTDLATTDAS